MPERTISDRAMPDRVMIEIDRVTRSYGAFKALDDANLTIREGEFFSLLGPSGCGKTTLLRMIAGFDNPTSGTIAVDGQPMAGIPANRRPTNMVFQSYAIFPHLNVEQNVAYGLKRLKLGKAEEKRRVEEALAQVSLTGLGKRGATELSGGQRQRVALARAIVTKPRVLLLDEPLSALDKALRVDMQVELKRIQREVGITTIFVTHDQEEALTMADRIGILRDGCVIQEGPPEDIYDRPRSEFAATFLGDANVLRGEATETGIRLADGTQIATATQATAGGKASCAVRPERIRIAPAAMPVDGTGNMLRGQVSKRIFAGNSSTYFVDRAGETIKVLVRNDGSEKLAEGQDVVLRWSPESTVLLG